MAVRIKFDNTNNVIQPTFVLAHRNGKKLGIVPSENLKILDNFNSYFELSMSVNKFNNGKEFKLWNDLKDFKLIWCREWDVWFEIYVELEEENDTVKYISAISLGEAELSQINLYGIEVNTEDDIAREDYEPTTLFNENNVNASLLHRISEKIPHYKFKHVDSSIANLQRTFTFDGIAIYDAFQEISKELNCIFIINSGTNSDGKIAREINVYDIESNCLECGHREDFTGICPECGSENIIVGYGDDTTIFVSTENLADNINFSTDTGSVKNCFRLEAGDDLMTATILNCNPNGSGYIWYISDELRSDMSDELVNKLNEYDKTYNYYQNDYEAIFSGDILDKYNELVEKYKVYSDEINTIKESVIGYPALMSAYYDTIDMYLLLHDNLMPSVDIARTTAALQAARLGSNTLSPVAVKNLDTCSSSTASSAVLAVAKTIVRSDYQVKLKEGVLDGTTWYGNFTVTNYSDETDTATSVRAKVEITDDFETYVRQRIDKTISNQSDEITNVVDLFNLSLSVFEEEIKKYCLSSLESFRDCCETCMNVLIEQGVANSENWENKTPNLYSSLYEPYYNKYVALTSEIKLRESEIELIMGTYDSDGDLKTHGLQTMIEDQKTMIQDTLNFEEFLGEELWLEFVAYRREDTYSNENFVSDGLNTCELFNNALEFIEVAKKEIYKSATLQHSISASLKNLLVMKEFSPITEYFKVGNWLRIRIDNNIYRLRLISYELDFENLDNISITFSDVKRTATGMSDSYDIFENASAMQTTYGSIKQQANKSKKNNQQLNDWVTKGLALTKMKIIDSADNQNITWDSHGLLCKEYLPITDSYDDKQLKIINRGLYLTDDAWKTSKAGIGDFTFYNPMTGQMEEAYGVIADTLVGNLILSEKVGIYNTNNSITLDENGLTITTDGTAEGINNAALTVQKKTLADDGTEAFTQVLYLDGDGNLVLTGSIHIQAGMDESVSTLNDLCDTNRLNENIAAAVHNESQIIYDSIDARYKDIIDEATEQLENYKADLGQYMSFNDDGLTLGATTSNFKTVIDNQGMYFKEGDTIVAYVNNNQLYIPNAIIENSFVLGKFFFNPRTDGGVSLAWQGD